MKINITARNTGIKDSFRVRVEKKLSKFDKFFGDSAQAQVTVIHSGDHETVEVTIKSEGMFFRAERTADEREEALEAVIDSFFMFRNADTDEINVVYKRHDGNYALIEPEAE